MTRRRQFVNRIKKTRRAEYQLLVCLKLATAIATLGDDGRFPDARTAVA